MSYGDPPKHNHVTRDFRTHNCPRCVADEMQGRIRELEEARDVLADRLERAVAELEDLGSVSAPSRYGIVNGSALKPGGGTP